jgi:hypothetical protein
MPESAEIDKNKCENKSTGVDKWNAGVLTITMLAVCYYTYLTNGILSADTRPYVAISIGGQSDYPPFDPQPNKSLEARLSYDNFGKQPADARIWQQVVLSPTRILNGPNLNNNNPKRMFIWPPPIVNVLIAKSLPLDSNIVNGLSKGGSGWLYIRAEAIYQNGHHTDLCYEYRVVAGSTPTLADQALCPDVTANSAN